MARYDGWSREDLIWKFQKLEGEKGDLEKKISALELENDSLRFRIRTELEPLLKAKADAYDRWVTTPR